MPSRLLRLSNLKSPKRLAAFSTTPHRYAGEVRIVEVGPRDGLQNEKTTISLDTKIELIRRLQRTGVRHIEAGSFVAPKWVPQMANSANILNHLLRHLPSSPYPVAYNFLIPNMKGLQNFSKILEERESLDTGSTFSTSSDNSDTPFTSDTIETAPITSAEDPNEMQSRNLSETNGKNASKDIHSHAAKFEISVFTAATEAFSKANTNCSIAESLKRSQDIVSFAKARNLRVRGYVSVALGCPYEGPNVSSSKVAEITVTLLESGVDEVSVADTTGMGTAIRTRELLKTLSSSGIANKDLALHFHDTYGQALVNTVVGLEHGISTFDSSVGGLGGCPFSKGATGNLATEDLVYCLHSLGAKTDVDLEEMAKIGAWISNELRRANDSRAGKAILAKLENS